MDILLVLFWAFFLCLVVSLLIITFPAVYPRESIKKGAKRIQTISLVIDALICITIFVLHRAFHFETSSIEIKTAIMLIPVIACLVFSIFLYYPSARFLVQKNSEDQGTMDTLLTCMFKCAYSDKEGSAAALNDLHELQKKEEAFLKQYGLSIYLIEYVNQAKYAMNNKPSESIIRCVLDRCNQVKHDIDIFTPVPFPNIGLILSFVFSTVLTVLLSIVTATP